MGKVLGIREIKAVLPQRNPMLMLDRAEQVDETHWVAVKNLTINEMFFLGHFPGHPIMPGVLQVEAMKQLGELAVRPQLDPAVAQILRCHLGRHSPGTYPLVLSGGPLRKMYLHNCTSSLKLLLL